MILPPLLVDTGGKSCGFEQSSMSWVDGWSFSNSFETFANIFCFLIPVPRFVHGSSACFFLSGPEMEMEMVEMEMVGLDHFQTISISNFRPFPFPNRVLGQFLKMRFSGWSIFGWTLRQIHMRIDAASRETSIYAFLGGLDEFWGGRQLSRNLDRKWWKWKWKLWKWKWKYWVGNGHGNGRNRGSKPFLDI